MLSNCCKGSAWLSLCVPLAIIVVGGSTHSGKDDEAIPDGMESRLRASARAKRSRASPTGSEAGTAAACATATTDGEVTGAGTAISAVHPGIDGRGQRPSQSTAYGSDHGSEMPCTAWSDSVMRRSVRICKKVSLQELSQEEGTDSVHQSEESSDGRLNSGSSCCRFFVLFCFDFVLICVWPLANIYIYIIVQD